MKNRTLLVPVIAIFALTLFILSGTGMNKSNSGNTGTTDCFTPFSASVGVAESNRDRTHTFDLFFDGEKTLLDGYFSIDHERYPGKMLFDGTNSYLFRPEPNQSVVYSNENQVIYGFLPVNAVINDDYDSCTNTTVLKKDETGFPVEYEVEYWQGDEKQRSVVSYSKIVRSNYAINEIDFTLPPDTKYISIEEYIKV